MEVDQLTLQFQESVKEYCKRRNLGLISREKFEESIGQVITRKSWFYPAQFIGGNARGTIPQIVSNTFWWHLMAVPLEDGVDSVFIGLEYESGNYDRYYMTAYYFSLDTLNK